MGFLSFEDTKQSHFGDLKNILLGKRTLNLQFFEYKEHKAPLRDFTHTCNPSTQEREEEGLLWA